MSVFQGIDITAPDSEQLLRALYEIPLPVDRKDRDELIPLRSWLYDPLFIEVIGLGPYQLQHCQRGRNHPPDWTIKTPLKCVSIEATNLTTPRTEVAERHGRSTFDTLGVCLDAPPDKHFHDVVAGRVKQEDPYDGWEPALPNDSAFFNAARRRLRDKHDRLQTYYESYDLRVLLILEKLWSSGSQFKERSAIMSDWLAAEPANAFDAVIMTNGGIRTDLIVRLK